MPAKYIEFEITESMAFDNYTDVEDVIALIHESGACCSMDDFGKSYSNLNALMKLQFDTVKMDMCLFEKGFPQQDRSVRFIEDIIRMFKNMGLEVIAEGIERSDQVSKLKEMGCDLIQGYYYSEPVSVGIFEEKWM